MFHLSGGAGSSMHLVFASSNPHKVREVRAILLEHGISVTGLDTLDHTGREPVEDGPTFADNARIKALHYTRATGCWCLADDSGLVVDALGGEPGVRSARYAGVGARRADRDEANNTRLLRELQGVAPADRTARFVCSMCLADAGGTVVAETTGAVEGVIGDAPRGDNGFGYDPLFELPRLSCTSAELPPQQKNALSHRGEALRKMMPQIQACLGAARDG